MKKIIRLTESDLIKLINRVIDEQTTPEFKIQKQTTQKHPDWLKVISYVQKNPAFDNFKFHGFVEGIKDAGIELRNQDLELVLNPDGEYTVFRLRGDGTGKGLYSGKWGWENNKLIKKTEDRRYSQ